MDKIKYIIVAIIIMLFFASKNSQNIGCGYWYDMEGKRVLGDSIDIPPIAEIMENNNIYTIVKQTPQQEKEEAIYEHDYYYPLGRDTTYYWVLFKEECLLYGPLLPTELDSILVVGIENMCHTRCINGTPYFPWESPDKWCSYDTIVLPEIQKTVQK